jgi:outer membrane receptor protein involved in Fe transport
MDIARIEALPGPQGTLFGASAQSGTLRIITNQPDPSRFEASFDTTLRGGEMSDESYDVTGMLNIPIVEDVFAIRIAAKTAEDGGFIDNVFGHTPDTWKGITAPCCDTLQPQYNTGWYNSYNYYYGGQTLGAQRAEFGTLDNAAVVEKNWNSVEHLAYKIAARWDINDNWAATLTYNHANNEAHGENDYNPFVGDLQTIAFAPNLTDEEWDLTSLTIEGDLGFAQFVSATSWFERNYAFSQDQTIYYKYWSTWACEDLGPANGYFGYYNWDDVATGRTFYYPMYCPMGPARSGDIRQQADYIGVVEGPSWQDKFAQEFRLSHQGEKFDWLAGLYYEDSNDNWDAVWLKGITADYQDTLSLRFAEFKYGQSFPDAEYVFLSQDRTNWKQKAVFGEVTWHITAELHATFGGRWFETENTKSYLKYHAGHTLPSARQQGGVIQAAFAPGTVGGTPVFGKISEFVPKFSLSWNFSDDKMLYGLYTEGFRTGGINRANSRADWSRTRFPQAWEPDLLKNSEIGLKTRWADGTVQFNLTYFHMAWEDFQIEVVDPSFADCIDPTETPPNCTGPAGGTLPWLKVVGNAGDALSQGVQAELAWIPAEGWDVGANAQWLEAEIDETLIIETDDDPPFAPTVVLPKGTALPNTPEFKASGWISYAWPVQFVRGGEMVLRGQYSYTSDSQNLLVPSPEAPDNPDPSFTNDSYAIGDVRLGLISHEGGWQVDLFVYNITDERAQIFINEGDKEWVWGRTGEYEHVQDVFTNRPREYGLRFSKKWGD